MGEERTRLAQSLKQPKEKGNHADTRGRGTYERSQPESPRAQTPKAKAKVQEWDPDSDDEEESDESEEE